MSYSSKYGYFVRGATDNNLTSQKPLSVNDAQNAANNLIHMRDQAAQVRVNANPIGAVVKKNGHAFTFVFPWSRRNNGGMMGAVLVVRAGSLDSSHHLFVCACLCPDTEPKTLPADINSALFTTSYQTTSMANTAIINTHESFMSGSEPTAMGMRLGEMKNIPVTEYTATGTAISRVIPIWLYRLTLWTVGTGTIYQVYLREYNE
jgi:hypothetical protein